MLFGQLWKGKEGFGNWMYLATGIMPALLIVPNHKSEWNCLACNSLHQPADLLHRLWDYVKTCSDSCLLSCRMLKMREKAWGEMGKERQKGEGVRTETQKIKLKRKWDSIKNTKQQAIISDTIDLFHFLTHLFSLYKWKNTYFSHMNTHVSLMLPIIAPVKLSSGESHWDLLGNCARELVHPNVFMTGHFKWPQASLLLIHFLYPLILLFFPGLCLVMSLLLCCSHSQHQSPS